MSLDTRVATKSGDCYHPLRIFRGFA